MYLIVFHKLAASRVKPTAVTHHKLDNNTFSCKCNKFIDLIQEHICSVVLRTIYLDSIQEHLCSVVFPNKNLDNIQEHSCSVVPPKQNLDSIQGHSCSVVFPIKYLDNIQEHSCSVVLCTRNFINLQEQFYSEVLLKRKLHWVQKPSPSENQPSKESDLCHYTQAIHDCCSFIILPISTLFYHLLNMKPALLLLMILALITCVNCQDINSMSKDAITAETKKNLIPDNIPLLSHNSVINCNDIFYAGTRYTEDQTIIFNDLLYCRIKHIRDFYNYDHEFMFKGLMVNQSYTNIIKVSLYVYQNTMLKHNFINYIQILEHLFIFPFTDIFSKRFNHKQISKHNHVPNSPSNCSVGGGKVLKKKDKPSNSSRGTKFFEGSFLSQYSCFTLKDRHMCSVSGVEYIVPITYELMCILPKKAVLCLGSDVDLIAYVPVHKILNSLTKKTLSTLPYISDNVQIDKLSRIHLILDIETNMSNCQPHELYSVFKMHKRSRTAFPKKDDNLKVIQKPSSVPDSLMDTQESNSDMEQVKLTEFPPIPITEEMKHKVIQNYCKDMDPSKFHESGCAVCGSLTLIHLSVPTSDLSFEYLTQYAEKTTRMERKLASDLVQPINGPVVDSTCKIVCLDCAENVRRRKLPKKSMANGLWLGQVPTELSDLTFAEQLLIARVRINRFAVKVESGMQKTKCNIIAFQNPVPQIYDTLPPPTSDIEETFAVMFIRSKPPTEKDFDEIPLYHVRQKKVQEALEWLKLNHIDYENMFISHENLSQYPVNGAPVPVIILKPEDIHTNKHPESTSVNDTEKEEGVSEGSYVAVVHGLTEDGAPIKTWSELAGDALSHLQTGEKLLVLGHTDTPESLFKNPTLYSSAFPWLFPYGLGSIDNNNRTTKISAKLHKGHLLMYHDKRFQMDRLFSIFAFNHEQMKDSTTAGFIMTKQSSFQDICDRISNLDHEVLQDITERYQRKEKVKPQTAQEKNCFQLLNDLDKVAEKVEGSMTSKRHMRNELWSLVSYKGAPSWFITFAPADNFHPLCLYFADTEEHFIPRFRSSSDRYRLIAHNPVAGARFFHTMVQLFLKHVLGVDSNEAGLFGKPSAYYGTVEQQGRLTLHIHMLVWIVNSLSPQEIRNRIMDPTSDFQKRMIEYLESAHMGEYVDSDFDTVKEDVDDRELVPGYVKPTKLLPIPPPAFCDCIKDNCVNCKLYTDWKDDYKSTLNDIIFRVNKHACSKNNCLKNIYNMCKARFPRQVFESSMVDPQTGAICMKHKETMLNTFNPIMPYLQRCNSDATSLLSGTSNKINYFLCY